jgi:hypothetical protein
MVWLLGESHRYTFRRLQLRSRVIRRFHRHLLAKHSQKSRIDLREARLLAAEAEKVASTANHKLLPRSLQCTSSLSFLNLQHVRRCPWCGQYPAHKWHMPGSKWLISRRSENRARLIGRKSERRLSDPEHSDRTGTQLPHSNSPHPAFRIEVKASQLPVCRPYASNRPSTCHFGN